MGKPTNKSFSTRISSTTTDTQIFTSPWRIRKRYIIEKMVISNESASTNLVKFFDDDLSDATSPSRGDHTNAPLIEIYVPPTTTLFLTKDDLPFEFYQGGLVGYGSASPAQIVVEVRED